MATMSDVTPCRWAALRGDQVRVADESFVDLPLTEQVTRGQELLQMLKPKREPLAMAPPSEIPRGTHSGDEVQMIVKRTFIELVEPPIRRGRARALSDSALISRASSPSPPRPSGSPVKPDAFAELSDASTDEPEEAAPQQQFADMADGYWAQQPEPYGMPCMMDPTQMGELMPATCMAPFLPQDMWMPPAYDEAGSMLPYRPVHMVPAMQWQWAQGYADFYSPGFDAQPQVHAEQAPSVASSCTVEPEEAVAKQEIEEPKTTVLLRNLPKNITRATFLELLEDEGFDGTFDFVYLPIDFNAKACLGYAFVNFVTNSDAVRCWQLFDGFCEWDSDRVCEVTWGDPCQGLQAHIDRYRNSPVMHRSIPDEWKPLMFQDGQRVMFPPPTKGIKAPKLRRCAGREGRSLCVA